MNRYRVKLPRRRKAATERPLILADARGSLPQVKAARRVAFRVRPAYPRPGRTGMRRWVPSWRQVLGLVLFGLSGISTVVGVAYAATDIPKRLNDFATQQDNIYYWADGSEMARTGPVNRQDMPLDTIPEKVQWAVLSAENATFYNDSGVSMSGIGRAALNMAGGGDTQGGSTITQQYVKNAYLNQNQTFTRKFSEVFIAIKLDKKMSKREILQRYLNTSWFGRGAYGIERASWAYYGKDASELTPSEGAFIASLLKGAGLYDPAVSKANHKRAVARWSWTLDRMVETGHLSRRERASYRTFPEPHEPPRSVGLDGQTGYLVDTARAYVSAHSPISDQEFDLGGYQVHTTFEKPRVTALAAAVKKELKAVPGTVHVRAGAASVTTGGRIVALYGGPGYLEQGFNDANIAIVPSGTTFMPFVLASGMENGVLKQRGEDRTPVDGSTLYDGDDKVTIRTPEGPYWDRGGRVVKGANDAGRSWGQISLRDALANSVNTPFVQLGMDVGLDRVTATAIRAGMLGTSMGARVPAFSLGNSTPSPIRVASAYGTFADGGVHIEPFSVDRINRHGAVVFRQAAEGTRVLAERTAATVTEGLRDSVDHGAGHAAAAAGPGAAGKPGVAEDEWIGGPVASWFAGYRGEVSTAVAFFRVDPKKQELVELKGPGVSLISPTRVWTRVMSGEG